MQFTQISNTVLQGLCRLKPTEIKVMLYLLRHTAGYHRDYVITSYGTIAKWCGINRKNAFDAVKTLAEQGLVRIDRSQPSLILTVDTLETIGVLLTKMESEEGCG